MHDEPVFALGRVVDVFDEHGVEHVPGFRLELAEETKDVVGVPDRPVQDDLSVVQRPRTAGLVHVAFFVLGADLVGVHGRQGVRELGRLADDGLVVVPRGEVVSPGRVILRRRQHGRAVDPATATEGAGLRVGVYFASSDLGHAGIIDAECRERAVALRCTGAVGPGTRLGPRLARRPAFLVVLDEGLAVVAETPGRGEA